MKNLQRKLKFQRKISSISEFFIQKNEKFAAKIGIFNIFWHVLRVMRLQFYIFYAWNGPLDSMFLMQCAHSTQIVVIETGLLLSNAAH